MKKERERKINELKNEKDEFVDDIQKISKSSGGKISFLFLDIGLLLLALAVYFSHIVAAVIGIALIFWGAILFYIRPTKYIKKEIFDSTLIESIDSFNKLVNLLGYEGTPIHISPSTLWGLDNVVLYIPKSNLISKPSDDELSSDEIIIQNHQAMILTPPGLKLSKLIEAELKKNITSIDIDYLNLERVIVENLEISETYKIETTETLVCIEIGGSIFYDMIRNQIENMGNTKYPLIDPFNSAMACILARSTRKPVIIEKITIEPKEYKMVTDFKLMEYSD